MLALVVALISAHGGWSDFARTVIGREVDARGAIIDLGNGIEGQLRASELGRDRIEDARQVLKVGDEVEAKFVGVDRKTRSISLSIKAKEVHEEAEAVQNYRSEQPSSGTSFGIPFPRSWSAATPCRS